SSLVDVEAVKRGGGRLLDLAVIVCQVVVGEDATSGPVGVGDSSCDRAGIERVAAGADRLHSVVRLGERRFVGCGDRAHRSSQVRLAEHFADFGNAAARIVGFGGPLVLFGGLALA